MVCLFQRQRNSNSEFRENYWKMTRDKHGLIDSYSFCSFQHWCWRPPLSSATQSAKCVISWICVWALCLLDPGLGLGHMMLPRTCLLVASVFTATFYRFSRFCCYSHEPCKADDNHGPMWYEQIGIRIDFVENSVGFAGIFQESRKIDDFFNQIEVCTHIWRLHRIKLMKCYSFRSIGHSLLIASCSECNQNWAIQPQFRYTFCTMDTDYVSIRLVRLLSVQLPTNFSEIKENSS